jgi:16S rRNA (adenine1518-N6/adenine1519-N6)-dimethyltransferase
MQTRQKRAAKAKRSHGSKSLLKPQSDSASTIVNPSRRLGQNFLKDKRVIQRIISALNPTPNETLIEIGPGTGALTAELLKHAGVVIAVEFDRRLAPLLIENFGSQTNFKLVAEDALVTDFCEVMRPAKQARLVANLPYNISTAILRRLIEQRRCFSQMVLMLQREVVGRLIGPVGSSERGYLSVLIEAYCVVEKLFDVNPAAFHPVPKVWSTVVRLNVRPQMAIEVPDETLLWSIVSAGFAQRRKTILNNLRRTTGNLQELIKANGGASIVLCRAGIALQRRAETLSLEEWGTIARTLS